MEFGDNMNWLRQSTSKNVMVGPFHDSVDGVTAETSLTITQAEVRLSKNEGAFAQKNEATSLVHDDNGWYTCPLDATDTDTLGMLKLHINESGAGPVTQTYIVVPANVYDSLIAGTDELQVDADGTGDGSVVVDHDYGGTDALAYKTAGGVGIDNAVVRAYLKTDYDAGNTASAYIKASTTTDVNGRWTYEMNLDPATYTLYYFKQGAYAPSTQEVTVQ